MKHIAENVWDIELKDDEAKTGGISHEGEKVGEFCEETGLGAKASIDELNEALSECGIKPITKYDIRKTFVDCANDILSSINEHTEYVQSRQNVDCLAIVRDIRAKYTDDVIADVLANDVISVMQFDLMNQYSSSPSMRTINRYSDGRYSSSVKEWAFERVSSDNFDYSYIPVYDTVLHDKSHPTIINSLIQEYMNVTERNKTVDKAKTNERTER